MYWGRDSNTNMNVVGGLVLVLEKRDISVYK